MRFFDRVRVGTTTAGTGPVTLGAEMPGCQTFAAAGAQDGDVVHYLLEHRTDWEIGEGTYSAAGPTLSRTPIASSLGGSAVPIVNFAIVSVIIDAATLTAMSALAGVTFHQAVPSATWTIAHNMGSYPAVVVLDSTGGVIEGDVSYPDSNTAVLNFSGAFSGIACII